MRAGFTVLEMAVVLVVLGVLAVLLLPRSVQIFDRIAVTSAAADLAGFYRAARYGAVLRGRRVRVELRPEVLRAVYDGVPDSQLVSVPGPRRHGVQMTVTRAEIRLHPNGIGYGAANTKVVLRRGIASESLTTSRAGRLKRWR